MCNDGKAIVDGRAVMGFKSDIVEWLGSGAREAAIFSAIARHPDDVRVSFCVLVDVDTSEVVDAVAIPPASVDLYCDLASGYYAGRRKILPMDRHFGGGDQLETAIVRQQVQGCMTDMLAGRTLAGELVAELLHARRMSFAAAARPINWKAKLNASGTDEEG
jgi:hypothetical protein